MRTILLIILLLLPVCAPAGEVFPAEVEYFRFSSHMMDTRTGYLEAPIELTYVEEEGLVSLYYQSGCCKTALLLDKESREKLLAYIDKYMEWNKKAVEKKVYEYGFKKYMGKLEMGLYFKYTDGWHKAGPIVAYMHFVTVHRELNSLVFKPIKTASRVNPALVFKPEALYFSYEDAEALQQALREDFILSRYKKALSERKNVDEEFK